MAQTSELVDQSTEGDILSEVKDDPNAWADLVKPGQKTKNPRMLNKNTLYIRDLCRKHADLAVRTIVAIMRESPDAHARLKAADMILSRAYGSVKKDTEDGTGVGNLIINVLTNVPRHPSVIQVDAEVTDVYER